MPPPRSPPSPPDPNSIALMRCIAAGLLVPVGFLVLLVVVTNGYFVTLGGHVGTVMNHGHTRIVHPWLWWSLAAMEILAPISLLLCALFSLIGPSIMPKRASHRWQSLQWWIMAMALGPFALVIAISLLGLAARLVHLAS